MSRDIKETEDLLSILIAVLDGVEITLDNINWLCTKTNRDGSYKFGTDDLRDFILIELKADPYQILTALSEERPWIKHEGD